MQTTSERRRHRSTAPAGGHLAGLQAGRAPHDLIRLEQERAQGVRPQDGPLALLDEVVMRRHERVQLLFCVDEVVIRDLAQGAEFILNLYFILYTLYLYFILFPRQNCNLGLAHYSCKIGKAHSAR